MIATAELQIPLARMGRPLVERSRPSYVSSMARSVDCLWPVVPAQPRRRKAAVPAGSICERRLPMKGTEPAQPAIYGRWPSLSHRRSNVASLLGYGHSSANRGRRDISLNGGCSINHSTTGIDCPTGRARATRRTGASPVTQTVINSTAPRWTLRKWRSTPGPGGSREAGAFPGDEC